MLLKLTILVLTTGFLFFATVGTILHQSGIFVFEVKDKIQNRHLYLPVPMFLVNLATLLAPDSGLQGIGDRVPTQPVILQAIGRQIGNCPDGIFLEVQNPINQLLIQKNGDTLLIDINSPEKELHLRVPIASTTQVLARLAAVSEADAERQ